ASCTSRGLPKTSPSMMTAVSAPMTSASGWRFATARAFPRAKAITSSSGTLALTLASSKGAGSTSNARLRSARSARRLGEADARMILGGGGLVPLGMADRLRLFSSVRPPKAAATRVFGRETQKIRDEREIRRDENRAQAQPLAILP